MSFPTEQFIVDLTLWINQILKLGLGDTSEPGLNERRLYEENGEFFLRIWNGSAWVDTGENASQILQKLLTVDGSESGLNADLLDGAHKSFFQNAANLNTGNIPLARLGLLSKNNDTGETANPHFQWGTRDLSQQTIYFANAYTSTPVVLTAFAESTSQVTIMSYNWTTTSFTAKVVGDDGVPKTRSIVWASAGKI